MEDLIELAKRKNEAHKKLILKRGRAWLPSGTDAMKKVIMDSDTANEREEYDNLADELTIRMMFIK